MPPASRAEAKSHFAGADRDQIEDRLLHHLDTGGRKAKTTQRFEERTVALFTTSRFFRKPQVYKGKRQKQ